MQSILTYSETTAAEAAAVEQTPLDVPSVCSCTVFQAWSLAEFFSKNPE